MERIQLKPTKSLVAAMMIAPAGWANAPGGGDELSLADLLQIKVRSAGFFSMDATKAPGSIFVISPDMIRNSPARDLSELLDLVVPGTAMGHHEMHGPLAGVRGILIDNSSKTLVMRDGQAMNARTAYGYPYYNLPLLGDINSIEIINGPGGIVHGSGAINGFVNLIPKTGADNPGSFVDYRHIFQSGNFTEDHNQLEFGHGMTWSGGDGFFYGGVLQSDGFIPNTAHGYRGYTQENNSFNNEFNATSDSLATYLYPYNDSTQRKHLYYKSRYNAMMDTIRMASQIPVNAYPKPSYRFSATVNQAIPSGSMGLQAWLQNVAFSSNSMHWAKTNPAWGNDNYRFASQWGGRLKYTSDFLDAHVFEAALMADANIYGLEHRSPFGNGFSAANEGHWEGKAIYRTTVVPHAQIAVGGLVGQRMFDPDENYLFQFLYPKDVTIPQYLMDKAPNYFAEYDDKMNGQWTEYAGFAEANIEFGSLAGVVGGRYDLVSYDEKIGKERGTGVKPDAMGHFSPRAALSYQIDPSNVVKLSYQEGFRYPDANNYNWWGYFNTYLRDWVPGIYKQIYNIDKTADQLMIADLKPEVMRSVEANYHTEFMDGKLQFDLNGFWNFFEDMLLWKEEVNWADYPRSWWSPEPRTYKGRNIVSKSFDVTGADGSKKAIILFTDAATGDVLPIADQEAIVKHNFNTQMVQQTAGWYGHSANETSSFQSIGGELMLKYRPDRENALDVSYSYSRPMSNEEVKGSTNFEDSADSWKSFPGHMVKVSATRSFGKIAVNLSPFWNASIISKDDTTVIHPQRFWLNAKLRWTPTEKLVAELGAINLLGSEVPAAAYGRRQSQNGIWEGALGSDEPQVYTNVKYSF